jgi:hypothetical protein
LIFVKIVDWWKITEVCVLWSNEYAEFGSSRNFKILFALNFTIRISSRFIKLNSDPVSRGKFRYQTYIFYFTSSLTHDNFTTLSYTNSLCLLSLKVIRDLIAA